MQVPSARFSSARTLVAAIAIIGSIVTSTYGQPPPPRNEDASATELKLDEILRMLQELKAENRRMAGELNELRPLRQEIEQIRALLSSGATRPPSPPKSPDTVAGVVAQQTQPPPPGDTPRQGRDILWRVPDDRLESGPASPARRFALLGVNAGRDRAGNLNMSGRGRYFAPFGDSHALQAEGEFLYYGGSGAEGRQEGQFDFGLINRWRNIQAGGFASFKHLGLRHYQNGGTLGQAAFTLDYIFGKGKAGFFGTKGFMNEAVLNRANLGPTSYLETYARVVDQAGVSAQVGLWKTAFVEGNLGALWGRASGRGPGGMIRLTQPVSRHVAVTFEGGWRESFVNSGSNARFVVGLQLGNWIFPADYKMNGRPVPVDIPRIRYELLTRRVGNSTPVADAGPNQTNARPGEITLDGSASRDPDGDALQYEWVQTGGPGVALAGRSAVKATFTGVEGQAYSFRLKVTDPGGMSDIDRTEVAVLTNPKVRILRFAAQPNVIKAGQSATLIWETEHADSVEISSLGPVAPAGTTTLAPLSTTVYQLTARNKSGEVSETATVQVERAELRILRFYATPTNIQPGEPSNLIWAVENADSVEISTVGPVSADGATTVSPKETASYVLTARKGSESVSARATVSVAQGKAPRIVRFSGTPPEIAAGEAADLTWEVEGATEVLIEPAIGAVSPNGVRGVQPAQNTTYTLTARNQYGGSTASVVISVFDPVRILDFTATPTAITVGQPARLAWKTENATSAVITGVGVVPVNGSIEVKPGAPTSYTLVAYGKRGNVSAFVLIKTIQATQPSSPVCVVGSDQRLMTYMATLDASLSYHPGGLPMAYAWRFVSYVKDPLAPTQTEPVIPTIGSPNSAVSSISMPEWGIYTFELTVRDSLGQTCTATSRVNFIDP